MWFLFTYTIILTTILFTFLALSSSYIKRSRCVSNGCRSQKLGYWPAQLGHDFTLYIYVCVCMHAWELGCEFCHNERNFITAGS